MFTVDIKIAKNRIKHYLSYNLIKLISTNSRHWYTQDDTINIDA
jgi:hypothetical protein